MPTIKITKPTYTFEQGIHRVSAYVQDEPLWFDSSDISLRPSPEAFASAILIAALEKGYDIEINSPLNSTWISNIKKMAIILAKWWGYQQVESHGVGKTNLCGPEEPQTALCFSSGVDSFFNLLHSRRKIDYLVYVHGYDIPLSDIDRMSSFLHSLQNVSEVTGASLIVIKTNLREHPVSSLVSWERAHGGALAATGHLLNSHIRNLIISASYPFAFNRPWGSHWETDPLWSSESLQIVHEGASFWRAEKLRTVVEEPLVRKHLKVCADNRDSWLNCCHCEKCIRTMLVLAQSGKLDDFPCFHDSKSLAKSIDELPFIGKDASVVYKALLDEGLEMQLAKSVEAILQRSRRIHKAHKKVLKNGLRRIAHRIRRPFLKKLNLTYC